MNFDIAIGLCKTFEGFRSKPYLCPAGIATIGIGITHYSNGIKVSLQDPEITISQAQTLLEMELIHTVMPAVLRLCPVLATDEKRLNAIMDFAFNLGVGRLQSSTLRRKINAQDWPAAQVELSKWVRGGGKILPGLVKRRQAEALLLR